jgi:exonuclease III
LECRILDRKATELVDAAIRRCVNILCAQETGWADQNAGEVEDIGFKLWYSGSTGTRNGVGVLIDKSLQNGVVDVRRQRDRIIIVKLVVGTLVLDVISAYSLQVGLDMSTE